MRRLIPAVAVLGLAIFLPPTAADASAAINITATVTGVSATQPTNGVLYLKADATALHHTRSVEYYDHDGYRKTAVLRTAANPLGSVLAAEYFDNNCGTYTAGGSVNPPGGDGSNCHPVLWTTPQPGYSKANGDLLGRYCRVAQLPDPSPADCTADSVVRSETASGTGRYLTVGDKDHGGLVKVSYYTNVAGTDVEVTVVIPSPVVVTEIVLLPAATPSAVVILNGSTP